jgi:transcriptional regulator with XRE-family HTH domain
VNKNLLKKIKLARVSIGISRQSLAQLTKLNSATIYRIEHGYIPTISTCSIILEKLGAKVNSQKVLEFLRKKMNFLKLPLNRITGCTTISYGTLQKLMAGETPSLKTCCKLAKELDMPLEDFIEWPESKK